MPIVKMPDGTQVRFPDDMPREQIRDMIASKFPDAVGQGAASAAPTPTPQNPYFADLPIPGASSAVPQQAPPEAARPAAGGILPPAAVGGLQGLTLGAYDELASLIGTPIKAGANLISGADSIKGAGDVLPFLGRSFQSAQEGQQALTDQAYEDQPWAANTADVIGSLLLGGGMAKQGASLMSGVTNPTVANMLGRGAAEGAAYGAASGLNRGNSTTDRLIDAISGGVMGGVTGGAMGAWAGRKASQAQIAGVPNSQEIKDQAATLYQAARQSGVTTTPAQSQTIADDISSIARGSNVLMPSGSVNPAYPKVGAALRVVDEYAGASMTIGEIQAIRQNLADAAASIEPGERRIGSMMLEQFDNFASALAPELKEANQLYRQAKLGELIDTTIELAQSKAGQFSGSGMENALRTEFRALERQIIKGQLRGIPAELEAAIKKVAQGGPMQEFARNVGKFAPTGVVSAGMSGGVPFMVGNAVGGPAAGGAAAAATMGAGLIGRKAATDMAMHNAEIASALARSGSAGLPAFQYSPVVEALLAGTASQSPRMLPNF